VAYAGGVYIKGALRLVNCTITDNHTSDEGGGVYVRGLLDFMNTIIAHNSGEGGNCVIGGPGGYQGKGEIGMNTNNLVVGGTCDPALTDDPQLGALTDNGGDTLTHALLPGSPAIDAVPAVSCTLPTISGARCARRFRQRPRPHTTSARMRCTMKTRRARWIGDLGVSQRHRLLGDDDRSSNRNKGQAWLPSQRGQSRIARDDAA